MKKKPPTKRLTVNRGGYARVLEDGDTYEMLCNLALIVNLGHGYTEKYVPLGRAVLAWKGGEARVEWETDADLAIKLMSDFIKEKK